MWDSGKVSTPRTIDWITVNSVHYKKNLGLEGYCYRFVVYLGSNRQAYWALKKYIKATYRWFQKKKKLLYYQLVRLKLMMTYKRYLWNWFYFLSFWIYTGVQDLTRLGGLGYGHRAGQDKYFVCHTQKSFFLMACFLFLLVIEYNLTGQGMDRCYDFESSASVAGPGTLLGAGFTTCDSPVFENIYI